LEFKKHIYNPNYFIESGQKIFPLGFHFYIIGIESINSDRVFFALNNLITKLTCQYLIIVDESSFIKSFYAKRTHRIINLSDKATYRVVMTGTPITQYYQDLFMQFRFLDFSIIKYRSYQGFCNRYLIYHDKYKHFIIGAKNMDELLKQVSPHIYQVKKSECLDLPEKLYKNYYCSLSKEAREKYNKAKDLFLNDIDSFYEKEKYYQISLEIFKLYLRLQRIVSNDFERRIELLKRIMQGIQRVCIICKFIKEIETIKKEFPTAVLYTGNESFKQRASILENIDNVNILLMTFGVGSHGLNLASFNTCIYYSNVFKYGERLQSEDRFHRIGQTKNVLYVDIVCENTIDEVIQNNLSKKEDIKDYFEKSLKEIKSKKELKEFIKKL
jgi:SNF2 family DNA or RNA helicase